MLGMRHVAFNEFTQDIDLSLLRSVSHGTAVRTLLLPASIRLNYIRANLRTQQGVNRKR